MLERIEVICFAASYTVALVLEISRLLFRSGVRGAVMLGFAGAGLVAHSVYLYYRLYYRAVSADGSPLSSEHDWYLIAAWVLVVAYLYLVYYHPRAPFGLFLLPLVLGLIATAWLLDDRPAFVREPASKTWGIVHGTSILLAVVSVSIGFAAGLMYLGQAWRLKRKRPPIRGLRLPSLEWLQRANGRAIVVSVLMLGVGVLSGIILALIRDRTQPAGLPWHDPVVLSTGVMFTWLLSATVVGAYYKPARQGRKVAYLTVVSFVFLVIALAVILSVNTKHGGRDQGAGIRGQGSGNGGRGTAGSVDGSELVTAGCGPRGDTFPRRVGPADPLASRTHPDTAARLPLPRRANPRPRTASPTPDPGSLPPRPRPLAANPSLFAPGPSPLYVPGGLA